MGKTKAPAAVDALIALGAESVAADATGEAQERLPIGLPDLRVGLVVADDAEGGWTRREFVEMGQRFRPRHDLDRGWLSVFFWSSESPTRSASGVRCGPHCSVQPISSATGRRRPSGR